MSDGMEAVVTPARSVSVQKKWFTLIGVLPLGFYTISHLLNVSSAWSGPDAFDAWIDRNHQSWTSWIFTAFILFFVGYHAVVGIKLMLRSSMAAKPSRLLHLQYLLQRLSAIGILLFIPAHVIKARLLPAFSGTPESFAGMHEAFTGEASSALTVAVYLLGTLGVTYHLSNGIWTACVSLGLTQGADAQKRVRTLSIVLFLFLLTLAYGTIFRLIQG